MPGLFITLEGIDRSGKGTQQQQLVAWMQAQGMRVVAGHEPNNENPVGAYIQRILTHTIPAPASADMQRLYILDRAQDAVCYILPALAQNAVVVWDRYIHSSLAFAEDTVDRMVQLHKDILGPYFRWPDITFLLDLPVEEAMRRLTRTKRQAEYFERREQQERVRARYRMIAERKDCGNVILIDGNRSSGLIFQELQQHLQHQLQSSIRAAV